MPPNEETRPKKKLRILYADDMRELRDVVRLVMTREGHAIECVADGREALDRLVAGPDAFDLVITDHHMPQLNGIGLVRQLRARPYAGKILVFCSELSAGVSETYLALKVDRILYKPVFPSTLRQVLRELFAPVAGGR